MQTKTNMKPLVMFMLCYVTALGLVVTNVWNHKWSRAPKQNYLDMPKAAEKPEILAGVALIVPTRDRDGQWEVFEKHMCAFWGSSRVQLHIWRIEQTQGRSFNRAWLFNVGFKLHHKLVNATTNCIAVHDVDLLPEPGVNYTDCLLPTQVSSELEHFDWGVPYTHNVGGVLLASPSHWAKINGMSNSFWGWGGEDDELFERLKKHGLLIDGNRPRRPVKGVGRFRKIREGHNVKPKIAAEYDRNVGLLLEAQRNTLDPADDGLSQTAFALQGQVETERHACDSSPMVTVHTLTVEGV
jgi:hypothetical protein